MPEMPRLVATGSLTHLGDGWLVAPDNSRIPVHDVTQTLRIDTGRVAEVRWTLGLDGPTWARVDARGWLHLAAKFRGPCTATLDASTDVWIEARLGAEHLHALWEAGCKGDQDVGMLLLTGDDACLFRATEAWWGLTVTTVTGEGIRAGFKTVHYDTAEILPPSLPFHLASLSAGGLVGVGTRTG